MLLILFRQENLGFPSGSRFPPDLHLGAPLPRDSPPTCWIFKSESWRLSWLLQWQQLPATSRKDLATALTCHFKHDMTQFCYKACPSIPQTGATHLILLILPFILSRVKALASIVCSRSSLTKSKPAPPITGCLFFFLNQIMTYLSHLRLCKPFRLAAIVLQVDLVI